MRGILRVLPASDANRGLTLLDLAREVYGPDPTRDQLTSVTRAVRRLINQGLADRVYSDTGVLLFVGAPGQPSDSPINRTEVESTREGIPTGLGSSDRPGRSIGRRTLPGRH